MKAAPIDAELIAQQVAARGLDWFYREQTASTNADVLQHYAQSQREVVAVCETQSAGRGRRGRQWHSPRARNIYCTIGLLKALPANRQGLLSIVTGLALCRAIEASTAARVELKWPNDLLAAGEKLGGILIESRPHDNSTFFFAIGFGINLFLQADEIAAIGQPATSLDRLTARPPDRNALLAAAIDSVVAAIRDFDHNEADQIVEQFRDYDAMHGRRVEVLCGSERRVGINRGISATGELRLETENGEQLHSAAEISLRSAIE